MSPPAEWVTLASLNAKERKVVLELGNVYDFNNKSYFSDNLQLAEFLQQVPAIVEKYKVTLSGPDEPPTSAQSSKNTVSTTHQVNRTSCTNDCTNGSCVRTFSDGTKEKWQAPRSFDPINQNWGWDTSTNACGL